MPPSVLNQFSQLLSDPTLRLPPALTRRLWEDAVRAGDEDRMVRLIGRGDTPPSLLPEYAAQTSARVRQAYLSRRGITTEEALATLATETRVTVLAALAGSPATPEAVLTALAATMETTGSTRLATALARSDRAPSGVLLRAATLLADRHLKGSGAPYQSVADVQAAIARLDEDEVGRACATLPAWACEPLLGRAGLGCQTRLLLLETVLAPALRTETRRFPHGQPRNLLDALLELDDLQLPVMAALDEVLAEPGLALAPTHVEEVRRNLVQRSGGMLDRSLDARQRAERAALLAASEDPDHPGAALASLCVTARAGADRALAARLCANPATPAADAATLVDLLDTTACVAAAYRAQREPTGRDPLLLALLLAHCDALFTTGRAGEDGPDLGDFDDPARAAQDLIGWAGAALAGQSYDQQRGSRPLRVLTWLLRQPLAAGARPVLAVPWQHLASTAARHTLSSQSDPEVTATLAELDRALGEDLDAWRTLERLGAHFTGTLADLLDVAAAVRTATA